MPWDVNYVPRDDTVVLTHTGHLSTEDVKDQARQVISVLKETNASRLLLDYSDSAIDITPPDLFTLPAYYASLGAPRDRKIANVVPKTEPHVHAAIYHKIVAQEKGYNFALFTSKDRAMQWLDQDLTSEVSSLR